MTDRLNNTLLFNRDVRQNTKFADIAEVLVKEFGLDVNHVNNDGKTPLIRLLEERQPKSHAEKLLSLGAHVSSEIMPFRFNLSWFPVLEKLNNSYL